MTDDRLKKIADEPAFPRINGQNFHEPGLTKREYFAAMAMQGMLSGDHQSDAIADQVDSIDEFYNKIAELSTEYADALIKELNK